VLGSNKTGVVAGGFGKTSLSVAATKKSVAENKRISRRIDEIVDYVKLHKKRKALIVTYKEFEPTFAGIEGVASAHFNAISGLDQFGDVDVLFVIGRPFPQAHDTRNLGLAVFGKQIDSEDPQARLAGVLMRDGSATEVQTFGYNGDELEEMNRAVSESEVIQSIGRGRGVNRTADNPLDVHYLGDVILPFEVDEVRVWKEVAPSILDKMWIRGGIAWSPKDAAKMYPGLFRNENAARVVLQRAEVGHNPLYICTIGNCAPPLDLFCPFTASMALQLTYQPAGAGQRARKASVPWDRADPFVERLKAIHGPGLQVIRAVT
jgi:hypothetical protein